MISDQALTESFIECARVCRKSGSSFPWLFRVLQREQRRAMTAIYAYCRVLDDAVDNGDDREQKRTAFNQVTQNLDLALKGETTSFIYPAVADTIQEYHLPVAIFQMLAKGMVSDLEGEVIRTEAELLIYCDRVAGTVGRMVIRICGVPEGEGNEYAIATGRALQLTNILRDLREDISVHHRCYIPESWLREHNVTPADILNQPLPDNVRSLLNSIGKKTEEWFQKAEQTIPTRYQKELRFAETLRTVYWSLFTTMHSAGFDPNQRVSLSSLQKIKMVFRYWFN